MSDQKVIIEGEVKQRVSRKWRLRWIVLSKLSPVADCIHLQIYRDSKDRCKNASTKSSLSLDGFLAMETGFTLEKESNTIAIICKDLVVLLAFDTRELLIQWQVKIKAHLCEEQHFLVQITSLPTKSKLSCGPARLHLQDHNFCLVSGIPPRLLGFWPIKQLRRFGVIDGKFCFEGGSHCGKGAGLHVLHTNQCEELAKCFELALNGRLHEKRRLSSNKNSSIDGSIRMSLQQTKCHQSCECGSNESSRPLISSSSESSVCEVCSEIIRFSGSNGSNEDNEISGESDENYSSRSTCSTILRCSSNLSCNITQPFISTPNVATDNDCFLTAHHSLGMLNCADNRCSINGLSNIDSNTLPKCSQIDNNRSSWATGSSCGRCGHHYWADIYGCNSDVLSTKTLTNNTLSAINLTEFRSISPSSHSSIRDCFRHNNHTINNINKNGSILPDRASLCSQSSQSSGASNSSNGSNGSHSSGHSCRCSSEYSVPRTHHKPTLILDSLYDKPKNIQHKICNNINRTEHMAALCSCQLDHLDLNNKNIVTSGHRIIPTTIKTNDSENNCNNLSMIQTKDTIMSQRIEDSGEQHYSVPRTALANIYLKELKASQNLLSDNVIKNIQNCYGDQYDVPRKFRESLSQPSDQSICWCGVQSAQLKRNSNSSFESNASICEASTDMNRTSNNNNTVLTNNCHQIPGKAINQCMVSLSQNWESKGIHNESELILTRLGLQRVETISGHNEYITDKHLAAVNVCPNCPETIGINKVRDKQWITTTDKTEQQNRIVCMERVNEVNKQKNILSNCCKSITKQSTGLQNVNYVNMNFVKSIPLYENMEFIANNDYNAKDNKIVGHLRVPIHQNSDEKHLKCRPIFVLKSKNLREKSMDSSEYILMQPIMSTETTYLDDKSQQKSKENILVNPSIQHLIETTVNSNKNKSSVLKNGIQPINEFKRRLSYRQRSNSSERGYEQKVCISSPNTSSCPPSPALNTKRRLSNRHFFITSKLSYKSKEKSFSIDDLSSAQLSLSNNHCIKFGNKISFHKSADCLKQRVDDYRSSDEDLCTSSQITVLCASPVRTGHRSANRVLSDICGNNRSSLMTNRLKTESKDHKNLNNCLNSEDSTSSSDMSDYIETLSLSSRTSSGSDPSYVRSDELTQSYQTINSTTIESKEEYSAKKMIDCVTHTQQAIIHQIDSPSPGYESENSFE